MSKNILNKTDGLYDKTWYGITMTDAAAKHIKNLVKDDISMLGLRLSVKNYGCAGFGYVLEKVTEYNNTDLCYEHEGAKLFVPLYAMQLIDGTKIDYVKKGLNYEFKFNNPKATHACGCGESFGF
ncbi:Fe-S cluster assembly scaffold SufA [Candidatus Palibaumannia cicadellinicola]|uniref:Iron binding protein for iron-sulfur cluster assembly n=1 Tax=Candidatus Palibaumannia cicadellinicola TaxID=186490 RepID=A0A0K2BLD1_9GAMM|nr:Fe-S cluster assembly scaffold SufA [Candidatus Baumannia cicadellinicola]AKZ66002.1 Iron binding protein for iron-sulfur cluster assembly [Candidatus Baumannia cicadellinicola]